MYCIFNLNAHTHTLQYYINGSCQSQSQGVERPWLVDLGELTPQN